MYFSASVFKLIGFNTPTLTSLSVAVTNCIFTILAILLIDRVGRRRILLFSIPVMVVGLLCAAISFYMLGMSINGGVGTHTSWAFLILVSVVIYVSSYALGLGNVPWQQSELFPLSVRSLGSGIATSVNWGSNFVVGLTFLPMMQYLTPSWTFFVYAVVCTIGWVAIWRIYPETKGLGLEEVGGLLKNGWGVRKDKEEDP
jgi:SP family myo-inositol transporter-like MFS transporter 13